MDDHGDHNYTREHESNSDETDESDGSDECDEDVKPLTVEENITVFSIQEAYEKITAYERNTTSRFAITWESKNFSNIDIYAGPTEKSKTYWELKTDEKRSKVRIPFDGIPFTKVGFQIRTCMHGPDRHVKQKSDYKLQRMQDPESNHANKSKRRHRLLPSKKMDCPATISLKAIIKYPQFKIEGNGSIWKRKQKSKSLKEELSKSDVHIEKQLQVYVAFPNPVLDHKYHITGQFSGFSQSLDNTIIEQIHSLVNHGVRSVVEMKRHLRLFVLDNIPSGNSIPESNRRYYPTNRDIRNHMYRALRFCHDRETSYYARVDRKYHPGESAS